MKLNADLVHLGLAGDWYPAAGIKTGRLGPAMM